MSAATTIWPPGALNGVFDSQIAGGKRYDLATLRRAANATFFEAHATDAATQLIFGMDLTPLVLDESKDIVKFVADHIERFANDVENEIEPVVGPRVIRPKLPDGVTLTLPTGGRFQIKAALKSVSGCCPYPWNRFF